MKETLLEEIERLHDLEKYQEIIDLIESLPAERLNTELIGKLASAYNNIENYEKALEILKTIEFEEGNSFQWNRRAGYSYFFLEDFVNAEKCFLKAYKLDPDDNDTCDFLIAIYRNLAKLENENRNSEKSIEYALKAKKYAYDEEGRIETDSFLAWTYNRYGKYEEAEEILRNQLARNKDNQWAYSELAYSLSEQGKFEEALENCFKAEDLGRNDDWLFTRIGICYKNLGKNEEALEYYLKALELSEDDIFIMSDIAWLYDITDRYEEALKYLERLEELGQDDAWTNTEFGYCLSKLGRYEEAIEKLNHALEVEAENDDKDVSYIYARLGWCKRKLGMCDEAIEDFNKAKKWGRNDAVINAEIGHCYKAKDEYEEALKYYLQAEKFDKKDPLIMSEIAWHYGRLEEAHPEEALKYLNIAKELGREDAWIYSQIGYQLGYNLETRKEALEHFDKALELGQNDAWIFEMRGTILLDFKRYEEALDSFKKAYDLNDDSWYLYSIGRCLRGLERYEEAIEVLLESRQLSLDEDDVVDGEDLELAHCYLGLGDKDNTQKYLNSARASLIEQGTLNDEIKEEIEKIEKGILSLDN